MSDANVIHPTLLMVGQGEPMDAALRVALDRHGLHVEECVGDVKTAVRMAAPDVVFLVGSAAVDGGRTILDLLAIDPVTNVVPVIVLGHAEKLDARVTAFRSGAVAVVPRTASADQIATRVADVTRELGERGESHQDDLGEATFDELVSLVAHELRSGILSVGRANNAGEPMRIVLGAGRPVADAVEEFVRKLRPLVSRAEPLVYELHASTGGPVGLLDPEPGGRGDLGLLKGLRVILVDGDASRADTLAQQLRGHGSIVAVADPSARGLDRARGLDPEVVIVDAAGIEGPGFEVVRAIRGDVRLRWAAMMVAPWADIWPETAQTPDLAELVERIRPLVVHDQALRERAMVEPSFDTRLEATGPSRLLRVLASLPGPFHLSLRNRKATVEVDVAEGLVVGARATRAAGDVIEGPRALAAMLAMASSRVHVEKRSNPSLANLMSPVEEALSAASQETAPIPLSTPPPPMESSGRGLRPKPFPPASEVGRGVFEDDAESSGPRRAPDLPGMRLSSPKGETSSRDLKWADSEIEGARPSTAQSPPQGLFSNATNATPSVGQVREPALRPRAALSAFGDAKVQFPSLSDAQEKTDDPTRIYASDELARAAHDPIAQPPRRPSAPPDPGTLKANKARVPPPPPRVPSPAPPEPASARAPTSRKQTLVMGAPHGQSAQHSALGSSAGKVPASRPPLSATPPRSATLTMGTADGSTPPSALPSDPPVAAARFPAPGVLDQLGTTAVPTAPSKTTRAAKPRTLLGMPGAATPDPVVTTSDFEALTTGGERDDFTEPGTDTFGDRTDPATPSFRAEGSIAVLDRPFAGDPGGDEPRSPPPPLPGSAFAPPPPRARVATPMIGAPAGPAAQTSTLGAPELPPLGRPSPEPVPPSARAAPAAASVTPQDPTPLGVISAPTPPSGIPLRPSSSAPPAIEPPPGAPVAKAPRRSPFRGLAWALVALGATALASVAGWIGWTHYGAAWLAARSGGTIAAVGPAAAVDAAAASDAGGVAIDAADLALVVAPEAVDAGAVAVEPVVEIDAAVAEAVVEPAVEIDAAVAVIEPPPADPGGETAEQLVARAEGLPDAQAEALYRRAAELDPRNHYAMLGLAGVLMRRGAAAEAIPFIEGAIRRRGRRAEYRVMLGDARRDSGDMEGARAAWREALEIDPEDHAAHERLGD